MQGVHLRLLFRELNADTQSTTTGVTTDNGRKKRKTLLSSLSYLKYYVFRAPYSRHPQRCFGTQERRSPP